MSKEQFFAGLARWVRVDLPSANARIDDARRRLVAEAWSLVESCDVDSFAQLLNLEHFNYVAMIHASLARHGVPATTDVMKRFEKLLTRSARELDVHPRFLAIPYLHKNPHTECGYARFTTEDEEIVFIEENGEGVRSYRRAAEAVAQAVRCGLGAEGVDGHLSDAAAALNEVKATNLRVLKKLSTESFDRYSAYYLKVTVGRTEYRGVNAGDQPWASVIDLALGVSSHVPPEFCKSVEDTQKYLAPEDRRALADFEARMGTGLRVPAFCELGESPSDLEVTVAFQQSGIPLGVLRGIVGLVDAHADASRVHDELVWKFILRSKERGGKGAGDREPHWLFSLTELRRSPPGIYHIRKAIAAAESPGRLWE